MDFALLRILVGMVAALLLLSLRMPATGIKSYRGVSRLRFRRLYICTVVWLRGYLGGGESRIAGSGVPFLTAFELFFSPLFFLFSFFFKKKIE